MIESIGRIFIRRSADDIIAFVSDLHTYKLADWKIGRVLEQRQEGERVVMCHDGKMRGIPGPPVVLELLVTAPTTVRYRSLPSFPSCWVLTFDGGFDLQETPEGTWVIHTERFHFFWPWRWGAERFLRQWLAQDIQSEMTRLKILLESSKPSSIVPIP